jgi:hypothetical protein
MTLFRMYYATDQGRSKIRPSLQICCTYNQSMLLKKRHGRGDEGHCEALMGCRNGLGMLCGQYGQGFRRVRTGLLPFCEHPKTNIH